MNYYFRYATKEDVDLIFNWANEEEVRRNSFCSEQIKYEDHVIWYERLLADTAKNCQLILMEGESPVAQCRLKIIDGYAEVGYSVDCNHRGKGIGSAMLAMLTTWIKENRKDVTTIVARVKPDNEASYKAFTKNGYEENYRELRLNL